MPVKRSKTSLAVRLNAIVVFRQFMNMLWLNIVICVMFGAGILYFTEMTAYTLLEEYAAPPALGAGRSGGIYAAEADRVMSDGMVLQRSATQIIYWVQDEPQALYPPDVIVKHLPEPLLKLQIGRWLYHGDISWSLRDQAESLVYQMSMANGGGWLVTETYLGLPVNVFFRCLMTILIIEGLFVLATLRRNSRSIYNTLRPLQELAASAQALTAVGGPLSPEALKRLAGALDSINVSHLDARLPLTGISDELKPLAAAINEMLGRIDEAYREQVRFVSDASHELRTPIAVIQGYADLLSRWGTEDPDTMRESIAAIRQEARAMKEMVEQLLFLARGESDFMSLDWKTVDVSALGAEVLREIEMIDADHRFQGSFTPSVLVEGDDGLLKQLMRILVDNSIKYTPAGGQITIRVEEKDGQAAIHVQDEGAGIPEDAIPHIFDRFYRADESRTRETGGAGLGLSIAKWIAQRHKGAIEVTSRENIGTRMTALLPLYKEPAAGS